MNKKSAAPNSLDMSLVISLAKRRAALSGDQKTMAFLDELEPHLLKASHKQQQTKPEYVDVISEAIHSQAGPITSPNRSKRR
jgi:hypothetical protein